MSSFNTGNAAHSKKSESRTERRGEEEGRAREREAYHFSSSSNYVDNHQQNAYSPEGRGLHVHVQQCAPIRVPLDLVSDSDSDSVELQEENLVESCNSNYRHRHNGNQQARMSAGSKAKHGNKQEKRTEALAVASPIDVKTIDSRHGSKSSDPKVQKAGLRKSKVDVPVASSSNHTVPSCRSSGVDRKSRTTAGLSSGIPTDKYKFASAVPAAPVVPLAPHVAGNLGPEMNADTDIADIQSPEKDETKQVVPQTCSRRTKVFVIGLVIVILILLLIVVVVVVVLLTRDSSSSISFTSVEINQTISPTTAKVSSTSPTISPTLASTTTISATPQSSSTVTSAASTTESPSTVPTTTVATSASTTLGPVSSSPTVLVFGNREIQLGPYQTVTQLDLGMRFLGGTIPTEIGLYLQVTDLRLYNNQLTGPLPSEIGLLQNLKGLYLGINNLSSVIPTEVGLLRQLNTLALHKNALNGALPSEIGMMQSLTGLGVYENILIGTIPSEVGLLTNLSFLTLNDNRFWGGMPTEICSLTALTSLLIDCFEIACPVNCPCKGTSSESC